MLRLIVVLIVCNVSRLIAQDKPVPFERNIVHQLEEGLPASVDSMLAVLAAGESYLEAVYQKKPQWHTPVAERNRLFLNRGKAYLITGVLRLLIFAEVSKTESGVLPVAEQLVISFDSAYYYNRKAAPYAPPDQATVAQFDAQFAAMAADSIRQLLNTVRETHSLYEASSFQPNRMVRNIGKTLKKDFAAPDSSLATFFIRHSEKRTDPPPVRGLVWKKN